MAIANEYTAMYDGSGSGDLNINPETFYYSLIYVGKTVDSAKTLSNILGILISIGISLHNPKSTSFLVLLESYNSNKT